MPIAANRWLILAVLFFARAAMAYQFQTVASVGPLIIDTLHIDYAALGTLIGLYMLPGVVFALPGGVLGQRFGAKGVVLAGFALMAAGGALMVSDLSMLVFGGRLLSGVGAVLLNVMMTKMVADWFAGREIVTAMGILVASWPLGIALGLVSFPPLAGAYGVAAAMVAAALVALAALTLVALRYVDPPDVAADRGSGLRIELTAREWLLVSLAGIIWAVYNVAYIVLISFLPELFTARGYSLSEATRIVSLLGWMLILSVPAGALLAERLKRPDVQLVGSFGILALAAAALPVANVSAIAFAVILIAGGLPAGLLMALPAEVLRPENRAAGMGIFYTLFYAGMAILPGVAGMTRDVFATPAAPPVFAGVMMVAAALVLAGFRLLQRRSPVPAVS